MLYVIKHRDGTYFHKDGKIILYDSPEQATVYLQAFIPYAQNRLLQEGKHMEAMTSPMSIQNNIEFMEVDFDIDKIECGVIYMKDL